LIYLNYVSSSYLMYYVLIKELLIVLLFPVDITKILIFLVILLPWAPNYMNNPVIDVFWNIIHFCGDICIYFTTLSRTIINKIGLIAFSCLKLHLTFDTFFWNDYFNEFSWRLWKMEFPYYIIIFIRFSLYKHSMIIW